MTTPLPAQDATVTAQFTQALIQAAQRLGHQLPDALLAQCQQQSRISLGLQGEIWQHLCQHSNDPLLGLHLGQALEVGHLDTVGVLLMSCDTLGDALDALVTYHPIVSEGGHFSYRISDQQCAISYHADYDCCRAQRLEAVMASLQKLASWISGEPVAVLAIDFEHAPHDSGERYAQLLGTSVRFNCQATTLWLAEDALTLPLIQANPALRQQLRQLADRSLNELGDMPLTAQVSGFIRQYPHWGKEKVADALHLSGRHLLRKLAEEGSDFKSLREAIIFAMAKDGLNSDVRLDELAEQLGFSDDRAFAKAFKRWSGVTPAQFRGR